MSKVVRLQESLYNTPTLATPDALDNVLEYLDSRNSGEFELSVSKNEFTGTRDLDYDAVAKIGYLHIEGPLTYRASILTALCNLTSYQSLEVDFKKLVELGAKKVVLHIDSGGGEAYSCFETAALLRSLADKNGIRLMAYNDGTAGSAAYALGCVCHEFISNGEASTGSIGVVIKLRNISKGLQKAGVEDLYLHAGKSKVPFDKSGQWTESFINDLQNKIDALYQTFTKFVSQYRGISVKAVADTEARMFLSQAALNAGLIDRIMTREEFKTYLASGKASATKHTALTKDHLAASDALHTKAALETGIIDLQMKKQTTVEQLLRQKYASDDAMSNETVEANVTPIAPKMTITNSLSVPAKQTQAAKDFTNHKNGVMKALQQKYPASPELDARRLERINKSFRGEDAQRILASTRHQSEEQFHMTMFQLDVGKARKRQ